MRSSHGLWTVRRVRDLAGASKHTWQPTLSISTRQVQLELVVFSVEAHMRTSYSLRRQYFVTMFWIEAHDCLH